jgi:DNA polymerase
VNTQQILHLDYETFNNLSVKDVGAFRYAQDPSAEVILVGWALDDEPVEVWEPRLGPPPRKLVKAYNNKKVRVSAHNAGFEKCITEGVLIPQLDVIPFGGPCVITAPTLDRYVCTAALAASMCLPRKLSHLAGAIGLEEKKDTRGLALIRKFCMPQKDGTRVMPQDDPEAWAEFIEYCRQDVVVERQVHHKLKRFALSEYEELVWRLDHEMNARGIPMDMDIVHHMSDLVSVWSEELQGQAILLTDGLKTTQNDKLRVWLADNGCPLPNLQRQTIEHTLRDKVLTPVAKRVLEIRLSLARSSVSKLKAVIRCVGEDGRVRGTLLYCGAERTWRWSGKLTQPHNYPRPAKGLELEDIAHAIEMIQAECGVYELAEMGDPMAVMSSCLRGTICAPPGRELLVADYSAIEARVLCWLAGQDDIVALFHQGLDVYITMAAEIYGIAKAAVTKDQRWIGKQTVLGCGYQMGVATFIANLFKMDVIITGELASKCVKGYRKKFSKVKELWGTLGGAAISVVQGGGAVSVCDGKVRFSMGSNFLYVRLPSGRKLSYYRPKLEMVQPGYSDDPEDKVLAVTYLGIGKSGRLIRESTYGGKWAENIVQAISRDLMANGMLTADLLGYQLITTIHDELIAEAKKGAESLAKFIEAICLKPRWGESIPLTAEGYVEERWRKD